MAPFRLLAPVLLLAGTAQAPAQMPDLGKLGGSLGGLGGLGGGLPSIGAVGAGNAAGLLGYCIKQRFLGGANASGVLGKLAGQKEVVASPGYAAGEKGNIVTGNRQLPLGNLQDSIKGKVCNLVLDRAQSFLPR